MSQVQLRSLADDDACLDDRRGSPQKAQRGQGAKRGNGVWSKLQFKIEPLESLSYDSKTEYLVDRVIPQRGLIIVIGEVGCGKSFITNHLGMSVSSGQEWGGRAVKQGAVVYIGCEGAAGLRKRLVAAREHQKFRGPFGLIAATPNLGSETGDVHALIAAIHAYFAGVGNPPVRLIAVDTMARAMCGADENQAKDVGVLVANLGLLENEFQCAVVVVHHLGKDSSRGARGSNVLRAASDLEITVEKRQTHRLARITRAKDGEEGLELRFTLDSVAIGDGSTCLVKIEQPWQAESATDKAAKPLRPLKGNAKHMLAILDEVLASRGKTLVVSGLPDAMAVSYEEVRDAALAARFAGHEEATNGFRARLSEALNSLAERGEIGRLNDLIWRVPKYGAHEL
jgi:hypothetical protein